MLVCKITYATLDAKQGKMVDETTTAIVASTKGKNALVDAMKQDNKFEKSTSVQELFVNREAVEKALYEIFAKDHPAYATELVAHAVKALDGGCMFRRPKAE